MKLFLSPGACAMSCHIAFEEAGLKFEPMISKWEELAKLNPQGQVPVLQLDDGKVLTQNIAILTFVGDSAPSSGLLPKPGTIERAQVYQWLSFVASELHNAFGPLFSDDTPEAQRKEAEEEIHSLLKIANQHMAGRQYLVGDHFTVADSYFFVVYGWTRMMEIPTDSYPNLNSHAARVAERPAVQRAMKREGLVK